MLAEIMIGAYSLEHLAILAIVIGVLWLIVCEVVTLPPKAKTIIGYVLMAIFAIIAIKVLFAFV